MPPKKDKPAELIDWYKKIPEKFLLKQHNPYYDTHHIKLPFRMLIAGGSGAGKTQTLLSLIYNMPNTFENIFITTKNKDEPLYRFLQSKNDQINIKEGLENVPQLDKFDKDINHLVVFDDLVLAKDQRPIENYYIRARKLNCSVIYISQSYFKIPKIIRNNCSYMCLLKLSGQREVNMILSEFGLGVSKEQLLALYQYATKEKFVPLLIDMEAEPQDRFRKGFLEVLTVREEGEKYEPQ